MTRDLFNYTVIQEFSAGPHLIAGSMPTGVKDLETLHELGVNGVLSLTRRSLLDCPDMAEYFERKTADGFGRLMSYGHIPIPDGEIGDDVTMIKAIDWIDSYTQRVPTFVHCRGGIGRTGTVLIGYFVLRCHYTVAKAREIVGKRHHPTVDINHAGPMTDVQRAWVESLTKKAQS